MIRSLPQYDTHIANPHPVPFSLREPDYLLPGLRNLGWTAAPIRVAAHSPPPLRFQKKKEKKKKTRILPHCESGMTFQGLPLLVLGLPRGAAQG